ncbi:MAG: T9SS type A sorting domain-containing protein [Bacteroidota bacterium]
MTQKLILLVLLNASISLSQWNSAGVAVVDTTGGFGYPKMVADGRGGGYIIWMDARNGTNYGVFVQRLDSSGKEVFPHNGVPVVEAQNYPQLNLCASDGKGGIFFTWFDQRDTIHGYIYAQHMDSNGKMLWQKNGVKASDIEGLGGQVVADGAGGCIINFTTDYEMIVQRLDSSGGRVWGDTGISQTNSNGFINFWHSASDGKGGIIVCWLQSQNPESSDTNSVYAQRIRHDGSIAWKQNGVRLSDVDILRRYLVYITSDDNSGAIIAWSSGSNTETRAQRIDSSGSLLWGNNGVFINYGGMGNTSPISDQKGGAIIQSTIPFTIGGGKLYRINPSGIHLWQGGITFTSGNNNWDWPWLASDGSSGVIVVFNNDFNADTTDIIAQRIDSSGVVQWGANGVSLSTHTRTFKTHAVAVSDGEGGAIAVWDEFQLHGTYAGRISSVGKVVTDVPFHSDFSIPEKVELHQNYPNPFNPETIIKYQLPAVTNVRLAVFDILGRELATLANEQQGPGEYSVKLNAENYGSGIYFYRLTTGLLSITKKMVIIR